jgi:transcriptional regulator with XRE-family HTH domain
MVSPEEHSIGPRLKALREARQMSQQELATRAGVSISVVFRIEQGQKTGLDPRLSTLMALARGLDMEPDKLLAELLGPTPRGRGVRKGK